MGDIQTYENMTDFGKIRKTIVNYTVVIFGIIFILILSLKIIHLMISYFYNY